jgi:hypothetical protein
MEIQFFGAGDEYWLSLRPADPVYQILLDHFARSPYRTAFSKPKEDFSVEHQYISLISAGLRSEIEELVEQVGSTPEPAEALDAFSEATILERQLFLDLRDPTHMTLLRLHKFLEKLVEAESRGFDPRVFVVPELSAMDFHLLKVVRAAASALDMAQLREALRLEYDRMLGLTILTAELRETMWKDAQEIVRATALEQRLSRLGDWGLLRVEQGGGIVCASAKLRLIRL